MSDNLTSEQRHLNMQHIRSIDTAIEVRVRKELFARGFRYRKNVKDLPGKPDIVLPKYNSIIFIHGCFWHRHEGCKKATTPKTRADYWNAKFQKNVENDRKHQEELEKMGWNVIVLWECEIEKNFDNVIEETIKVLNKKLVQIEQE